MGSAYPSSLMAHYPLPSPFTWEPYGRSPSRTFFALPNQKTKTIKMHLKANGSQVTTLQQACKATSVQDYGMFISNREHEPAHFMLTIESFSHLSEAKTLKIESDVFEASGHKWSLILYPSGNKEENECSHISLYVEICDTESRSKGWEVAVDVSFFVYDHIAQTYVIFQDFDENRARFSEKKIRWGFDKLISLESCTDTTNGYLCNDSFTFGAEVFEGPKYAKKDRCLSFVDPATTMNIHTWTIDKLSAVKKEKLYSEQFKVGKIKWRLCLIPKLFSIYLCVHEDDLLPDGWRIYAKYKIRVKDQSGNVYKEEEFEKWFCASSTSWGRHNFTPFRIRHLFNLANRFLMKDKLIVEAEISLVGTITNMC